jgi:hypothetical protein
MRPNGNDQGFLASYFEFVDCNFIKEPRPNVAKGHERVFLRTLLSNFPSICSRQRIADSIAGFFVDRYLAFKRRTRRGPNKSLVIYPHPFLNFTRIDLGHGSGRAHSKGRHNGCKCGVEFQSNHFPNWLVTPLAAQESIIASIAVARLPSRVLPCNNQHSRWTRLEKLCHVNDHESANRVGVAVFSSGQLSLKRCQQRLGGRTCTKF